MAQDVTESSHKTIISKWATRKTPKGGVPMKQIVIKHKQGYKRADGQLAYRSETRHVPA